jgi:hypothetical protein
MLRATLPESEYCSSREHIKKGTGTAPSVWTWFHLRRFSIGQEHWERSAGSDAIERSAKPCVQDFKIRDHFGSLTNSGIFAARGAARCCLIFSLAASSSIATR